MKAQLVNAFGRLAAHEATKRNAGYVFKMRMYQKAARALKNRNFNSYNQAESILRETFKNPTKILAKVKELYNTGEIKAVQHIKSDPVSQAITLLSSVPQVGPSKAKELVVTHKITTIAALKSNQHLLNDKQKLGLKYYDELIDPKTLDAYRIPRSEIEKFDAYIQPIVAQLHMKHSISGSYRRGARNSGDIDVLLTGSQNNLKKLVQTLSDARILTDHFSSGNVKWLGMGKTSTKHRRIDFMYISMEEYPFAQMYFTGSKEFNEAFRGYARSKGYTLNEHGIKKVTANGTVKHSFKSEKDIFEFLDVNYIAPENRVQGKFSLPTTTTKAQSSIKIPQKFNTSKGVLLANVYKQNMDPTGYIASEKFDGIRALWTGSELKSRTNKQFHAPQWFLESMPKDVPLDGELYISRGAFEETASVVMKKVPVDSEWLKVKYMVFDLPAMKAPFSERIVKIDTLIKSTCKNNAHCPLIAAKHTYVNSKNHMMKLYQNITSSGGEGLMLRRANSLYVQKRSKNLLKVKPTNDAEAIINNVIEGKGKDTGRMGALQVHLKKNPDVRFKIGTGFNNITRQSIWNMRKSMKGQVVTFGYKGLTKYGIPRHPAFMRFRKNASL